MLRKLTLALAATAALATASLSVGTTPAEAWGWKKHHHHFHFGWRHYGYPMYAGYYGGCYVKRVVYTPWGPRVRLVNRCY